MKRQTLSLLSIILLCSLFTTGCRTKGKKSTFNNGSFEEVELVDLNNQDYVWSGGYNSEGEYIGEGGEFDESGNYVGPGGYDESGNWTGSGLFDKTGMYIGPGGGYDENGVYIGPAGAFDKFGNEVGAWDGTMGLSPRLEGIPQEVQSDIQIIKFSYDQAQVPSSELYKVDGMVEYLNTNSDLNLVLEGHCDERGSASYNMALGEKRALAVRSALISRGIASNRLNTLSFGEEAPINIGHNETAWLENRRVEMKLVQ